MSGFGFSAIGCLSFAVLSPELAVAMLMGLSLLTQASGAAVLWGDLRQHMTPGTGATASCRTWQAESPACRSG